MGQANIVILGSTGFIGAALLDHLRQTTSMPVSGYGSVQFDLTSRECADKLCAVVNARTVLVLTARARAVNDPLDAFVGDVAIATNVARCLGRAGARHCLYFSTTSVYGDHQTDLAMTEETPVAPTSLYGAAKSAGEAVLRHAAGKAGIPLAILRPCMVYGPGDTSVAYGPARFLRSILTEGCVKIFGDGSEGRDYLFIRDLAVITRRFIEQQVEGTYNVVTGRSVTFLELIDHFRAIVPEKFRVVEVERDRPKADQRFECAKLLRALGEFRFTDMEQGLRDTYRHFVASVAR